MTLPASLRLIALVISLASLVSTSFAIPRPDPVRDRERDFQTVSCPAACTDYATSPIAPDDAPCISELLPTDDAPSWIFRRSTYSHDPYTGARVAQYMRTPPVQPLDDPRLVTSRYRRSRTNLRGTQGSNDTYYEVQAWGNGRGGIDAEWERFHDAWKESYLQGGYYNQGPSYGPWGYGGGYPGSGYGPGYGAPAFGFPGGGYGGPLFQQRAGRSSAPDRPGSERHFFGGEDAPAR